MSKTKLEDTGGWTPVIMSIVEHYDVATSLVFGVIWRYCQLKHGICDASLDTIAATAHVSRSTAKRKLRLLCEQGFVTDLTPSEHHRPHYYQDTGKAGMFYVAYNEEDVLLPVDGTNMAAILTRAGTRCIYCGEDAKVTDHIIPVSAGGIDDPDNQVLCCERCNRLVGSRVFPNLYEKIKWVRTKLEINFPIPDGYKFILGVEKDEPAPVHGEPVHGEPVSGSNDIKTRVTVNHKDSKRGGREVVSKKARTSEEYRASLAKAMQRGATDTEKIREAVEKRFHISPNWQAKNWNDVLLFIRSRPAGQTLDRFADWWFENDWRGKEGAPPTCTNVRELWPQAFKGGGEKWKQNADGSWF